MKPTLKQAAQTSLDVQNACNLSGVVRSFADITATLWDEAHRQEKGTDWVNTHPVVILFMSKLCSLSRYTCGSESDNFRQAYDAVKKLAAGAV